MSDTKFIHIRNVAGGQLKVQDSGQLDRKMSKTRRIGIWAERICRAYFSDPSKRMVVREGENILTQDEPNDKLYYVAEGSFMCWVMVDSSSGERERLELFRTGAGGFVGVRSFFADSGLAVFNTTAECDSVVMWMDRDAQAVETDRYGSLREQFFPVIMRELEQRQWRLQRVAKARVSERIRLHKAEDMATLGQLAAGLAHELNNATSVLMSSSQHLGRQLEEYFRDRMKELAPWFEKGMQPAASLSSAEVRTRARTLMGKAGLDYETAKDLVRMTGGEDIRGVTGDVDALRAAWMTGRSCRDIVSASRHAANIIHSMKLLASGDRSRRDPVDVGDSLRQAQELLRDALKDIDVVVEVEVGLPVVMGNIGELMQVWLNLLKNAHEAMRDAGVADPRIVVTASAEDDGVAVRIRDNGPGIPVALRDKLFQPNFTTKSGAGHSMGLGLGLYIVKRIVDNYHGAIEVTDKPETCFCVRLPSEAPPRGTTSVPDDEYEYLEF